MKNLFKSKTAYDLIDLFIKNRDKDFYVAQISKELKKDNANTTRELEKLISENIIKVETKNNKKYYSFNTESLVADEIISLFEKIKDLDFDKKFNDKWMLAEDIPNMCPFFSQIWLKCFVRQFEKPGGRAYEKIAVIFRDYHLWFYYDEKDAYKVGEHLVNKMYDNPNFAKQVNKKIIEFSDKLTQYAKKLPETNLSKLSKKTLWDYYKKHETIHTQYYQWGWIPVAADMFCNNLTEKGKEILRDKKVKEEDINEYLNILTLPTKPSLLKIEQDNLVKIGIKIQEDEKQFKLFRELFRRFKEEDVKKFGLYTHSPEYEEKFEETVKDLIKDIKPNILKDLQNHYTKYYYTKFIFTEEQGVYNFEHYLKELVHLVNNDPDLEKTFKEEEKEFKRQVAEREKLIKKLKINGNLRKLFDAWGDFMITKIYRRFAQLYALYHMVPILEEMARRLNISLKELKFMTSDEIKEAIFNNALDQEEIKKRVKFSIMYADKYEEQFFTGEQANKALEFIQKEEDLKVDEISGQCGCQGSAKGKVKIVNVIKDLKKMEKGDILVSISTQPDLVPAMKKASAIITDQGGVTSHAAIVAREINIPCVIGTKIATKVLKDGDEVSVDATKGVVKIKKK